MGARPLSPCTAAHWCSSVTIQVRTQPTRDRDLSLRDHDVMPLAADMEDFIQVCQTIASASDRLGPELIRRFGGRSLFEQWQDAVGEGRWGPTPGHRTMSPP